MDAKRTPTTPETLPELNLLAMSRGKLKHEESRGSAP